MSAPQSTGLNAKAHSIIPYQLLQKISEWSRTTSGQTKLHSESISPHDYSMVSLLAGTTTSPEKNFGEYIPPIEPEVLAAKRASERKAITAIVNSVFSVFGAGFAAWWGADRTGWKDEYKVLFGLAVGTIVAISEGALFLIWSSRAAATPKTKHYTGRHKKALDEPPEMEDETVVLKASVQGEDDTPIRKRRQ
ncbi:hypothetical protein DFP72DRAFT_842472 [Ephemerocybe angulata]|uniref:Endoplasmic reticulum-based factor for assembly of V-ATPase-domain-containing protein n=1 Tax=Ephemerocybe angulata TaxID=980116 RepID=A0A8H6I9U9_9AGAR|nr:hypothetical protein DFP72DRAFT_842472 [Tulosesus angulatus]